MSITTANDLILASMKRLMAIGTGQTPEAEMVNDCFDALNLLLDEWSAERPMVFCLTDVNVAATGQQSYTIGPGANFNVPWVNRIERGYFRMNNAGVLPVDYPLEIIHAKEDYDLITLKTMPSFPRYVFLDTQYPIGNVLVWPVPQAGLYQIFLTVMSGLTQFTSLGGLINLPPAYKNLIVWNLAVEIAPIVGMEPTEVTIARATALKKKVMRQNAQIPITRMPKDLVQKGLYNIYTDRVN